MKTHSLYDKTAAQFILEILTPLILKFNHSNNLREKFSPGPGIEPGSPALRAGAITNSSLIGSNMRRIPAWPSGSSGWLSGYSASA